MLKTFDTIFFSLLFKNIFLWSDVDGNILSKEETRVVNLLKGMPASDTATSIQCTSVKQNLMGLSYFIISYSQCVCGYLMLLYAVYSNASPYVCALFALSLCFVKNACHMLWFYIQWPGYCTSPWNVLTIIPINWFSRTIYQKWQKVRYI